MTEILLHFNNWADRYKLSRSDFFRYLQTRDYVWKFIPAYKSITDSAFTVDPLSRFQHILYSSPGIYPLASQDEKVDTSRIKERNRKEFIYIQIAEEQWNHSLKQINECSNDIRHCLMQFKIVHRLHNSKSKINKWFLSVPSLYDKCQANGAALVHCYMMRPKIQTYWQHFPYNFRNS